MSRAPRVLVPGGIYHVTVRGNNRQRLFQDSRDYQRYLEELEDCRQIYRCGVLAYTLMPNHVHLVVRDSDAHLSDFMHQLNTRYTRYVNQRYQRVGQLYQGRFYARFIDRDAYLLEVTRYVHLNPVRAGLVVRPDAYPWSSYRCYTDASAHGSFPRVEPELAWSLMSGKGVERLARYAAFVKDMTPERLPPWEHRLRRLGLIGSLRFASAMHHDAQAPGTSWHLTPHDKCLAPRP